MRVSEILQDCSIWLPNESYNRENPEVSVLLPTFKRAESGYLEKAIDSVLDQTFKNLELIVIDDCSGDGTFDIIKQYMEKDSRVSCIRHQFNVGLPAISEYEGYQRARGAYIAFIFDDNEWQFDALSKTISFMKKECIKASYGVSRLYYGQKGEYVELGNEPKINISDLKCDNFIANGSVVLHREVIETVGLYDPHLSLTRLCDWDLWRRVADYFDFCATCIHFTDEHGAKLKDSLGNSYKMDLWAAEERMRYYRNPSLLPAAFANVDILETFGARSEFFLECMAEYTCQYQKKHWFRKDDPSLHQILNKQPMNNSCKRIIVYVATLTASEILYFDRIFPKSECVIKFCRIGAYTGYLALADAVVLQKNSHCSQEIREIIRQSGIDCYYFADDNYVELAEDYPENADINLLAKKTTRQEFEQYQGIILSSSALLKYFEGEHLHKNLILLEPSMDVHSIHTPVGEKNDKQITVAFMGGAFRNETLKKYVLPALKLLSRKISVNFYYPGSKDEDLMMEQTERLRIFAIPRDLSLNRVISRFAEKGIDIQIHCGPTIANNRYKTKNALINAVQLGACLVTSECEPFITYDGDEGCYLMAKDDIQSWYEMLYKLAMDAGFRKQMYLRAKEHCLCHYNGENTVQNFVKELNRRKLERPYYRVNKQYERLYLALFEENRKNVFGGGPGEGFPGLVKPSRVAESDMLRAVKVPQGKWSYTVLCDSRDLSELGIIFTSEGTVSGQVVMEISFKGYFLRRSVVPMQQFINNQWTYFPFDTLHGCGGKTLTISLSFEYAEGSDKLLLYEDIRNCSLLYRLLNKIGLHTSIGMNILYTDCRG